MKVRRESVTQRRMGKRAQNNLIEKFKSRDYLRDIVKNFNLTLNLILIYGLFRPDSSG